MKRITLLSVLFVLLFSINSYAGALQGNDKDISGGSKGSVTWAEAEKALDDRITKNVMPGDDIDSRAYKEGSYLVYVCTTHKQKYDVYYKYASVLQSDYGELDCYFRVLEEDEYNEKLKAVKKIDSVFSLKGKMIADSGFKIKTHTPAFINTGVCDVFEGKDAPIDGLCAGFSWLSIQNYLHSISTIDFNYAKQRMTKAPYNVPADSNTWSLDLSGISTIKNQNMYNFYPTTDQLHSKMVPSGSVTQEERDNYRYKNISLKDIKGTDDEKFLRALTLAAYSIHEISSMEFDRIWKTYEEYEDSISPCPAEELDLIIKELENKRPVYIGILSGQTYSHAIVGYAIAKDIINPNKYYLYVYDPNLPGDYSYIEEPLDYGHYIEIIKEKGRDGHEYLYYDYRSMVTRKEIEAYGSANVSRYNNNFTFIDADGITLHCLKSDKNHGVRAFTAK